MTDIIHLSTPVGVVSDMVMDGINGRILPFRDADAFAEVINALGDIPFTEEQAHICIAPVGAYRREAALGYFLQKIGEAAGRKGIFPC